MAVKKEKKQKPLEQVLMESCNKLRSNMSGINYMYFVMGLVFLKFASLKFEKRREEILNRGHSFFLRGKERFLHSRAGEMESHQKQCKKQENYLESPGRR